MSIQAVYETARALGLEPRAVYSVRTAAKILGIGQASLYRAVRAGKLKVIRVGRVMYVPVTELARVLESDELTP